MLYQQCSISDVYDTQTDKRNEWNEWNQWYGWNGWNGWHGWNGSNGSNGWRKDNHWDLRIRSSHGYEYSAPFVPAAPFAPSGSSFQYLDDSCYYNRYFAT